MSKNFRKYLLLVVAIIFIFPSMSKAETNLRNEEEVLQFVQAAFQAQVALSEKGRSLEEINELLLPFFTEEYQEQFLAENLVEESGQYLTYGTDFALFYIPFFSYSEEMKVVFDKEKIYVLEYFLENDSGPVSYESHYEGLQLESVNGDWKIAEVLYNDIPNPIIEQLNKEVQTVPSKTDRERDYSAQTTFIQSSFQLGSFLQPIIVFYRYGSSILNAKNGK